MDPISPQEFLAQPLRVHSFLAGVPLHDVWAVDLPLLREGITLQEFFSPTNKTDTLRGISWSARMLFGLRILMGRIFGWDKGTKDTGLALFAERLSEEDRARSSVPAGTVEGFFRVVYSFENEILREVANRTVHAAALFALFRTQKAYRLYFAVYVRKVSWITPVYMALIGPFRKWIVYPAIFRQIRQSWIEAFGRGEVPSA
jgi:hypothetical protein